MNWGIDTSRYEDFAALPTHERQERIIKVGVMTLLWFAPMGILLANMWVFYVLYEGLGLYITAAMTAVYFTAILLYVERQLSQRPAKHEVQDVLKNLFIMSVVTLGFLLGILQI